MLRRFNCILLLILVLGTVVYCWKSLPVLNRRQNFALKDGSVKDLDKTIVVTGLGVISPCGLDHKSFFEFICSGKSAVSKIDRFDASPFKCQIGAQIRDFDPKQYYKSKKKIKQNDLSCHYAVAAAHSALADAGIDLFSVTSTVKAQEVGVIVGSAFGGMDTFEKAALELRSSGPSSVNPYTIPMILGNTPAGIIAMETGAKGKRKAT
jgi:3-oxoacyl-[acyl-carrier-protein] synthase II